MLQHLHIQDLVLVDSVSVDFGPGMTALTGETGAGKSVLVDALGLALGGKADKSLIRQGASRAEVHALFDIQGYPAVEAWLQRHDLESEGECILRRILVREGRSRAFINSRPVPVQLLRELGAELVSLHGQHEHQRLLREAVQRKALDTYARHDQLLEKVHQAYENYRKTKEQFERLHQQNEERLQRLDYLGFQIDELKTAVLSANELEALEQEQQRLANAETLEQQARELLALLDEQDGAILTRLAHAQNLARALANTEPSAQALDELLENARIQLEESLPWLREFLFTVEPDPERLQTVDKQLGKIYDLARKHRVQAQELPTLLERLEQEYHALEHAEERLQRLQTTLQGLAQDYQGHARKLSASRKRAARKLAATISDSMHALAMPDGRFEVEVQTIDEATYHAHGIDRIRFLVATNPGQPLAPLAKVASGGELSRISLAIQAATASQGTVPALIFDEVDTGIGGAVAETVGRLLRQLGHARQVLCVTHLPQVAVQAHAHLRVEKCKEGTTNITKITPLHAQDRIEEIARMLGGSRISQKTLAHAQDMLTQVQDD